MNKSNPDLPDLIPRTWSPVELDPHHVKLGALRGQLDAQWGQRHGFVRSNAIDVETHVVVVRVEILLECVQLDGNELVVGVAVSGGVGQTQVLTVASWWEIQVGGDEKGEALSCVGRLVNPKDVD